MDIKEDPKKVKEFHFDDILPKNSCISDFRQMYLKKQSITVIDSSTEIHKELICKYNLCNDLLNMYLKREIITKQPRVRYKASNDLWEVRVKSEEMKLTTRMKAFLQVMSERGLEFLQKEDIFQDFVEIDNSTETFVTFKGKTVNLKINLDAICPQERSEDFQSEDNLSLTTKTIHEGKSTSDYPDLKLNNNAGIKIDIIGHKEVSCNPTRPRKGILKTTKHVDSLYTLTQPIVELDDTDSEDDSTNQKQDTETEAKCHSIILNFVLSLRRSIPADIVLKQFFSRLLLNRQRNMLMVFHLGPLIRDQEIVLYQYISSKDALKWTHRNITSEENEGEEHPNLDSYINIWMENENKLVHQFSETKDSIKDSIYEYQGLEKLQFKSEKIKKQKSKTDKKKEKQNTDKIDYVSS
ncbi:unnamed protein product [Mytilus coruscus]|uniref:Uncharacterized protein n=1 Tax=Mytilus coruscus TaxID=42192 RepID=A0A6J8BJ29_MYTCO|nr:unnamed protein product [Mytilus coruscus]